MSDEHAKTAREIFKIVSSVWGGLDRNQWVSDISAIISRHYAPVIDGWRNGAADDLRRIANLEAEVEQLTKEVQACELTLDYLRLQLELTEKDRDTAKARLSEIEEAAK